MKSRNIEKIYSVLEKDSRLVDEEGKLLKNKVQELAQKMDSELLRLILNDDYCKSLFIQDVDGIQVFDKDKFCWVVNSKDFLPDGFTKYKNAILLTDENGNSIKKSSDVVLEFPFKDCYLEADSTKDTDEREEVFYNETLMKSEIDTLLAPKVFCNAKKYDSDGEHNVTSITDKDNLIIKGNNLLALHSLVPKYKGQIKLMYWDVLYNTESDKVPYADSFKHTSWLTMMKNRLEVAKTLLKDDGVICIQCDDNEQAYLTILCDEIFGRKNRVNTLVVEMASTGGLKRSHKDKHFLKTKEYILVYSNLCNITLNPLYNKEVVFDEHFNIWFDGTILDNTFHVLSRKFPDVQKNDYLTNPQTKNFIIENSDKIFQYHPAPSWTLLEGHKKEVLYSDSKNDVYRFTNKDNPQNIEYCKTVNNKEKYGRMEPLSWKIEKIFGKNEITTLRGDLWKDFYKDMGNVNKEGSVKLSNGKKPVRLLYDLISAFTSDGDIVLDAYLGSGTTADVAHKMGRKYIGIEQLDAHSKMEIERMTNVIAGDQTGISEIVNWHGGGSFIYCELAKNSQNIIDRIISAQDKALPDIYEQLLDSPFLSYKVDIQEMEKQKGNFTELTPDDQRKLLISILDKNTLYINYSDMDDEDYALSDNDKAFTRSFYSE